MAGRQVDKGMMDCQRCGERKHCDHFRREPDKYGYANGFVPTCYGCRDAYRQQQEVWAQRRRDAPPRQPKLTAVEAFWSNVQKSEGCWLWQGVIDRDGYGRMHRAEFKSILAHRTMLELLGVDTPKGMVVMHTCDVPACVNPAHLAVASQRDNVNDAVDKGRMLQGARSERLTPDEVLTIRELDRSAGTRKEIASVTGIPYRTVLRVLNGLRYTNYSDYGT
jgi:hypothetical protein